MAVLITTAAKQIAPNSVHKTTTLLCSWILWVRHSQRVQWRWHVWHHDAWGPGLWLFWLLYSSCFSAGGGQEGWHMSCNKIPQAGWFHQQKCIFSQFWRLEVQDAGAVRAGFCETFPPGLQTATFSLSSHGLSCEHMERPRVSSRVSSSSKDTGPAGLGPLWTHWTLIMYLKALSPSTVALGVRASTCGLQGHRVQSVTGRTWGEASTTFCCIPRMRGSGCRDI